MTDKTNEHHLRNWSPSPEGRRTEDLQYIQGVLKHGHLPVETFARQLPNVLIDSAERQKSLWSLANSGVNAL